LTPETAPKVLLIDDDAALTAMLTEFLRGEGFETTAAFNGTDGAIAALGLVSLEDSKGAQIVYAPAPVIREEALAKHPEIEKLLAPVFASLDAPTLQKLNGEISVDGKDAKAVAAAYLKEKGFVK